MNFLEKESTIMGQYYSELLDQFDEKLKKIRLHLTKKKVLFHHDNAPAHSFEIIAAKLYELRYELLPNPPYSPDLASYDFFLFSNMKTWLARKKLSSNKEVIIGDRSLF